MHEITPTPEPTEAAFSIAIACGMGMAAELVATAGPDLALDKLGEAVLTTLTDQERGVLASAVALILDMRNTPDDPSTLPPVDVHGCSDPSCRICWGADQ